MLFEAKASAGLIPHSRAWWALHARGSRLISHQKWQPALQHDMAHVSLQRQSGFYGASEGQDRAVSLMTVRVYITAWDLGADRHPLRLDQTGLVDGLQ